MPNALSTLPHKIAAELTLREADINELAKVSTYLRTHPDGAQFFRLLETMVQDGRYLVRSGQTLGYYRDIQEVCVQHLDGYKNATAEQAQEMAEIMGWAVRLMRYYKQVGVPHEWAASRQPSVLRAAPRHAQQATPVPKPVPVPKAAPKKEPEVEVATKRELVTLNEDVKRGKAQVQMSDGETVSCTGFPAYPPAKKGKLCRADVTRQAGKPQAAKFKRWE